MKRNTKKWLLRNAKAKRDLLSFRDLIGDRFFGEQENKQVLRLFRRVNLSIAVNKIAFEQKKKNLIVKRCECFTQKKKKEIELFIFRKKNRGNKSHEVSATFKFIGSTSIRHRVFG